MKCQACGADVADDAAFCHKCGASMRGTGDTAASASSAGGAPPTGGVTAASAVRGVADRAKGSDDVEEKLWEGGFSAKAMVGTWLLCAALTAVLAIAGFFLSVTGVGAVAVSTLILVIWLYAFGYFVYRRLGVSYQLTTQRFMHMAGILVRTTDRIEVIDIDDVTFRQGLVQRALGVGTIVLSSSDRTHPQLVLPGIDDVQKVAGLIDDVRRKERRRRGIHIEQI